MMRKYYHYTEWEDFQSGMYNETKDGQEDRIQLAIKCLTDDSLCYRYMKMVTDYWKKACEQTFTNRMNHRSFLGQCACFIFGGCRDNETRRAWWFLTEEQRQNANRIADRVYQEWRLEYEKTAGD